MPNSAAGPLVRPLPRPHRKPTRGSPRRPSAQTWMQNRRHRPPCRAARRLYPPSWRQRCPGAACLHHLKADPRCARVIDLSRPSDPPGSRQSQQRLGICANSPVHCRGRHRRAQHRGQETRKPRRPGQRARCHAPINATGPMLAMKQLPLLARQGRIWAKLSARGSRSEQPQGWLRVSASRRPSTCCRPRHRIARQATS